MSEVEGGGVQLPLAVVVGDEFVMPILFLSFFLTSVSASLNSVDWSFDIKKVNILAPSWSSLGSPGTALRCTVQYSTQLPNPPQLPCTAPDLAALGFRHGSQTMRCTGVRTTDPGSVNSQICWAQTEERGSARQCAAIALWRPGADHLPRVTNLSTGARGHNSRQQVVNPNSIYTAYDKNGF